MNLNKELQNKDFASLSVSEAAKILQTHPEKGLSKEEVEERLRIFGKNIIEEKKRPTGIIIFFGQFKSPLILVLLIAGLITLFVGHIKDSLFIFAAVIVNAALGFYQENKAEQALAELKNYLKQYSRVIRNEAEQEIDAENLVPGDIIRLAQGDRVPADARLIFVNDLQVDEAVLTGESLPVIKSIDPVSPQSGLGDQTSFVFAGTLVTQGVATAIVCRTDFFTELGKITALVAESKTEATPLQAAIQRFSIKSSFFLGALTMLVFVIGILMDHSLFEMFLTSVAIAVSAIPEGLPVALTVILAIGVERMAKRNGVIRKLIAAEALGSTTVILTDKTGTLTMAKMELAQVIPANGEKKKELLNLALLNANVIVENPNDPPKDWRINGRMMEVALVRSTAIQGVDVLSPKKGVQILNTLPFNAVNKFSATLVKEDGKHFLIFFGAPDILVEHTDLSHEERKLRLEEISSLAGKGEMVLGVATQKITKADFNFSEDLNVSGLNFEGLVTFRDPVRLSVKEAIRHVEKAGINIVIVTGDHKGTAESVGREVGLKISKESVLEASELLKLSDEDLRKRLPSIKVIARVAPLDKVRIAKAFQSMGEVVAMTGDGVNDAPSIKQADIGIAMGSGTAVARDVADLVLLDDNFETIAAAVEEGRRILSNIRKVIVYLLSNVSNELLLIGGALVTGLALPLTALQILWVNFFSDSFPAIAFAFEKGIDGLKDKPKGLKAGLLDPLMKFLIFFVGTFGSVLLFGAYWILLKLGFSEDLVRTFIFASFGSYTLLLSFSVRSLEKNIFSYSILSNRFLLAGVGIGLLLMAAAVYVPLLQSLFKTVPLPPLWLLGVALIGVLNISLMEFGKWIFRQRSNKKEG